MKIRIASCNLRRTSIQTEQTFDILCCQETADSHIKILKDKYTVVNFGSGVCVCHSRNIKVKKSQLNFANTTKPRKLSLITLLEVNGVEVKNIRIGTFLLEEDALGFRQLQIKELGHLAREGGGFIFLGDTRIPEWQTIDLPDGCEDAWTDLGNSKNEATSDIGRPDRVWVTKDVNVVNFSTMGDSLEKGIFIDVIL